VCPKLCFRYREKQGFRGFSGAFGKPSSGGAAASARLSVGFIGRGSGIRTRDPLLPKQVLYQAELCPDDAKGLISGLS